jgi:hypothetical protein
MRLKIALSSDIKRVTDALYNYLKFYILCTTFKEEVLKKDKSDRLSHMLVLKILLKKHILLSQTRKTDSSVVRLF